MSAEADVIVVGSGASATSAAIPLARAGLSVLMLDVGNVDARYAPLIPAAPFREIRAGDAAQHRYFLGDDFEGVPFGDVRVGAQLTPPRRFIHRDTQVLTPLTSSTFAGMESLALGGLASGWGAVAVQFDDADLASCPIKRRDLAPHYEAVAARIGISGARDDLLPYYGDCSTLQPPLDLDLGSELLLRRYSSRRERLNRRGLFLGRARLAALSRDLGGRSGQQYHDMDFYSDQGRSVFRPAFAVEELRSFDGFRLATPYLVERFREAPGGEGVDVEALDIESGRIERFTARRLVLAAGVLGTARIVLRSFGRYDVPVPFISNPYLYIPCINTAMLGKVDRNRRHSLSHLGVVFEPAANGEGRIHAEAHSYRSLLLFKIAKESFLPVREGLRILRDLESSFTIFGTYHADSISPRKRCVLRRGAAGEGDVLEVHYEADREETRRQRRIERALLRLLPALGCWPLGRIRPGDGSSIHYGGTVRMTEHEEDLTVTPSCLLRGTRSVYVADGSVLPFLPAKAHTLTLMANADRVGTRIAEDLDGPVRGGRNAAAR
ncbi:MAG TPA: GMC oxidoreductase [Planctomycetota bacterium]|nr:GMC oxidoreductase [Planctomycetota bacterium]